MSLSQVREVTTKHRRAQMALRAATLKDLLKLWPAFDINNISRTWPAFEEGVLWLVQNRARTSGGLAAAYYREARAAAGIAGLPTARVVKLPADVVLAGLRIVGPINAAKQLALSRPLDVVAQNTLVNVAGEATRHVLNVGRKTVDQTVMADRQAIGWRRVTSGSACEFCTMLAGRGTVYKSDTVDFSAHRHCGCFPEPAFR